MPKSTKPAQSKTTTRTRKTSTTSATPTTTSATTLTSPLNHSDIAHRAYELFLHGGAMHGRDLEHWLQAEIELRDRSATAG